MRFLFTCNPPEVSIGVENWKALEEIMQTGLDYVGVDFALSRGGSKRSCYF